MTASPGLYDELRALVGRPMSDRGPTEGPDPVNLPMIRHWCAAFDDWNPNVSCRGTGDGGG